MYRNRLVNNAKIRVKSRKKKMSACEHVTNEIAICFEV